MRIAGLLVILSTCISTLPACGKWPPFKDDVVLNFQQNRNAIEQLEAAYKETEYWDVTFGPGESAETRIETPRGLTYRKIQDGTDWVSLLRSANVYRIQRTDGGFEFEVLPREPEDRQFFSHYFHDPGNTSEFNECQDDYSEIPCGACSISFDDGWWFETRWSPSEILSSEKVEQLESGVLPSEEYSRLSEEALRACYIEGYGRLGYPAPEE